MDIGKQLKRIMEEKERSAYSIAKALQFEVTGQTITDIKKCRTKNPGILTVKAIAHELGLTVSQLIGEVEPPKEPPKENPDTVLRNALLKHPNLSNEEANFLLKCIMYFIEEERSKRRE